LQQDARRGSDACRRVDGQSDGASGQPAPNVWELPDWMTAADVLSPAVICAKVTPGGSTGASHWP
jgi:hypothetical protein